MLTRLLLIVSLASVLTLTAVPAAGQRMAVGKAVVEVPEFSQLEVQPVGDAAPAGSAVRISVRANHEWNVVMSVQDDLRWRVSAGEYRVARAGEMVVLAAGRRGETSFVVEYAVEVQGARAGSPPVVYTLARL